MNVHIRIIVMRKKEKNKRRSPRGIINENILERKTLIPNKIVTHHRMMWTMNMKKVKMKIFSWPLRIIILIENGLIQKIKCVRQR